MNFELNLNYSNTLADIKLNLAIKKQLAKKLFLLIQFGKK